MAVADIMYPEVARQHLRCGCQVIEEFTRDLETGVTTTVRMGFEQGRACGLNHDLMRRTIARLNESVASRTG